MYRLKGNGIHTSMSIVLTKKLNQSEWENHEVKFKKQDSTIICIIRDIVIGQVHSRQELAILQHLLDLKKDYYAWIESVHINTAAIAIVRPVEVIIDLLTIAINTTGCDPKVKFNKYLERTDTSLGYNDEPLYIAKDRNELAYYLFGPHQKVLMLTWKNDQLFALKEYSFNHKPERMKSLLKTAKVFDARIDFYNDSNERQNMVEANFNDYFEQESGYLTLWKQYLSYEKAMYKQKAQVCKPIAYSSIDLKPSKVIFHIKDSTNLQHWYEEAESISIEIKTKNGVIPVGPLRSISSTIVEVEYVAEDTITELPFPKKGYLSVSTEANEIAANRRNRALQKTINQLTVIPKLGEYLSEPSLVKKIDKIRHDFPMVGIETLVNGKIPDFPQEQAIKAALNTQDLVLIQGPPGTGKTSVIQTIMKCLVELGQKEILLTSYQHLAVDNAMEGLTEQGMLSHRFGGDTYKEQMLKSYKKIVDGIVNQLVLPNEFEKHDKTFIEQTLVELRAFVGLEQVTNEDIIQLNMFLVSLKDSEDMPTDVYIALLDLFDLLPYITKSLLPIETTILDEKLLVRLQQLPVTQVEAKSRAAFLKWEEFLKQVAPYMSKEENTVIKSKFKELQQQRRQLVLVKDKALIEQFEEALESLQAICKTAIQRGSKLEIETSGEKMKAGVTRLIIELEEMRHNSEEQKVDAETELLQNFARQLQSDPLSFANVISKYATVKGVTCQQSVAGRHGLYNTIFDAVIIDEAARANPLDLLIPMTLGKKIILVGDHKQLPHILEPNFERDSEIKGEDFDVIYKKSLFERLYHFLPSSKRIMLKKQFRMHPDIGELISILFYPEGLLHGMLPESMPNDTGYYENKNLVWIDVPFNHTGESGRYKNERETEVLVNEVKQLLKENSHYSIGIITFYNEQLKLLNQKLQNAGIENQVQCGTVDAFQGKECDIVFLSTVRSNAFKSEGQSLGFLRSPNRLNVALSRARRLLVIVGDRRTLYKSSLFRQTYDYIKEHGSIEQRH